MSWWPLSEMRIGRFLRTLVCTGVLVLPLRAATAAETGGCESFAWPLSTEIAWMNASESETILSGAKLAAPPNNAISMTLLPVAKVSFQVAPTGKPKGDTAEAFGGIAFFDGASGAGLYQVSLSGPGWIDVVQNGAALSPKAHSGKSDCVAVRKSVRFEIGAGPFSVQLSGVPKDRIKIAIRRAE